jgi:hypothetical protein
MKKLIALRLMEKAGLVLLLCSVLLPVSLFAGEIRVNTGNNEVKYTENTYQKLSFTVNVATIQYRDVQTKLGPFTEINAREFGYATAVGDPKFPVYHRLIEVPLHSSFEISYSYLAVKEIDMDAEGITNRIIPAQAPVAKNITDPNQLPFVLNEATYQQNKFLGLPLVSVTPIGILRSANLARLDISPVEYNPVTHKLKVYIGFQATVTFKDADISATLELKKKFGSNAFRSTLNLIPNYKYAPDSVITEFPATFVIVAPQMFQAALQPFIAWKTQQGYKVIQAYTNNPAVGNTVTSIHNYLVNLYNNPPAGYAPQSYVLIVGDVAQVPANTTGGHPSDLKYGEYTGDNLPEAYYGRFSANDLTQLQAYLDRTLEYERYTMPNDAFLGKCTMVAGADASHQLTWGNGQINYGTTYFFNPAHNLTSHTYLQPEPSGGNYTANIHQDVSDGECYSNYTAHGSEDGWADPSFSISDIPALQNAHKYALLVGNCCKTANFSVTCFAEEITRTANKGAVGYIGCSDYSYWDEDYWWGVGFKSVVTNPVYDANHLGGYDCTFHDHGEATSDWAVTMAQMVVGGLMAVEESSSGMKQYYWETYTLFGDPSLSIYFGVPPAVTAQYTSPIIAGTSSLQVVTEAYATVALSIQDTVLLDAKTADVGGIVNLTFPPATPQDSIKIVVNKQNRKPHINSIPVIPAQGPYVILNTFTVDDSIGGNNNHLADFAESVKLNVTVHNMGVAAATGVQGTLSTADTNVLITAGSYTFGSIPAGGSATGHDAFALNIRNDVADQHKVNCTLVLTDGTNTWNSTLWLTLNAPSLQINGLIVLDPAPGGNNNGVLDPGESATLKISTANNGHASVNNTIGHVTIPASSTSYIIATNPDQYLGSLAVNGSVIGYYPVIVNGITPNSTTVSVINNVTAGGSSQYAATSQFDLVIGQSSQFPMTNGSATTCNGTFLDSGGSGGNYQDNEDYTMTFNPGNTGARVKAVFTSFSVEEQSNCAYDYLKIYDGPTATGNSLGTFCGTNSPGTINASTSSGALTFVFHSDYSVNMPGWEATITCVGGPLALIANAFPANVCLGSTTQLTAIPTGGSGNYTYQWNPTTYLDNPTSATPIATPAQSITYTCTVNDGSSNMTSSPIAVTVSPLPAAPTISENGCDLNSSSSTGNQWYLNDALIPGATAQTYTPSASGTYAARILDPGTGCYSVSSNTILFLLTGIERNGADKYVSIYPNPFRETVTISYELPDAGSARITVTDAFGKTIRRIADATHLPSGTYSATLSGEDLPAGIYYCRIQTDSYSVVKKVILSK